MGPTGAGRITGTAAASGGATLSSVAVTIENTTTTKCWNGSGVRRVERRPRRSHGDDELEPDLPGSDLVSNDSLLGYGQATDSASNAGTSTPIPSPTARPPRVRP